MKCERYDHKPIEKKWQDAWEKAGVFHAENDSEKPNTMLLLNSLILRVRGFTWGIRARIPLWI